MGKEREFFKVTINRLGKKDALFKAGSEFEGKTGVFMVGDEHSHTYSGLFISDEPIRGWKKFCFARADLTFTDKAEPFDKGEQCEWVGSTWELDAVADGATPADLEKMYVERMVGRLTVTKGLGEVLLHLMEVRDGIKDDEEESPEPSLN